MTEIECNSHQLTGDEHGIEVSVRNWPLFGKGRIPFGWGKTEDEAKAELIERLTERGLTDVELIIIFRG